MARFGSGIFLNIAGGWLVLTNLGHTWGYYNAFVTRQWLSDDRRAAYELMKHPVDGGMTNASLWTVLQMLALELTIFLAFVAAMSFWLAGVPDHGIRAMFSCIATITFALALTAFIFVHPQVHAATIAAGGFLCFLLSWLSSESMLRKS